ncbi:MAG: IS701 family transposase [Solirubrobacteraceae bacterium]
MCSTVMERENEAAGVAGVAPEVKERLAAFMADVAGGLGRSEQRHCAERYARGLLEAGARKSLEPIASRLGEDGDYEALQHFLADSPWDAEVVQRAVAERVAGETAMEAWVIDDTGIPKDGKHSPGVKRQYSGTLGKIGNCQIAVSVHAVGGKGTVPLDWALYLPEEWCTDRERRRKAKIPEEVEFQTKPELAAELIERAARWEIPRAPVLGDEAYGKNTELRTRLDLAGIEYVLSINADARVYEPETVFSVPERKRGSRGPAPSARVADREPRQLTELAALLKAKDFQTLVYTTRDGEEVRSRFAAVRVIAAHPVERDRCPPREEWLIIEWPEGDEQPSDYWISNLPADTTPERLARLARLRWMIELDYRQLKGELGLDHYEGRSYLGFHHHCAIVTAAHGFLTLERQNPNHQRPA